MRPRKLLRRLQAGHFDNVRFADLQRLAEACGFQLDRITGSHHIYVHSRVPLRLNLQEVRGTAKPYQVRQLLAMLDR
ncbi:MAG TPA: type II toxin-antitoxin system HicA family toxin [Egibacteraceae bacterium]|nr:type II toxin-antitoxin system HicA family toxin [Egibacteraceae bacterium]